MRIQPRHVLLLLFVREKRWRVCMRVSIHPTVLKRIQIVSKKRERERKWRDRTLKENPRLVRHFAARNSHYRNECTLYTGRPCYENGGFEGSGERKLGCRRNKIVWCWMEACIFYYRVDIHGCEILFKYLFCSHFHEIATRKFVQK